MCCKPPTSPSVSGLALHSPQRCSLEAHSPCSSLHVNTLPDEVLQEILSKLPFQERLNTAPLVCTHWAGVTATPSDLWREVTLSGTRAKVSLNFDSLLQWFSPRSSAVRKLTVTSLSENLFNAGPDCLSKLWNLLKHSLETLIIGQSLKDLPFQTCFTGRHLGKLSSLLKLNTLTVRVIHGPLVTAEVNKLSELTQLESLLLVFSGNLSRTRDEEPYEFPAQLFNLRKLQHVEVRSLFRSHIPQLPSGVANWAHVKSINFENMGLEKLPVELAHLQHLEELVLPGNSLGLHTPDIAFPDQLSRLTSLKRLNLAHNGIMQLPDVLGHLTALTELELSGNSFGTMVRDLPSSYKGLVNLNVLFLTTCNLHAVPATITHYSNLISLKLNVNRLGLVPGGDYLKQLQYLDLRHNDLRAFPDNLSKAPCLEVLGLSSNCVDITKDHLPVPLAQQGVEVV